MPDREDEVFVPSRPMMYERLLKEAEETPSVQESLKGLPRKERRAAMRRIARRAFDDIRQQMIAEMNKLQGE